MDNKFYLVGFLESLSFESTETWIPDFYANIAIHLCLCEMSEEAL